MSAKEYILAYIDILGFSEFVKNKSHDELEDFYNHLLKYKRESSYKKTQEDIGSDIKKIHTTITPRISIISDSIIISCDIKQDKTIPLDHYFQNISLAIMTIAYFLIEKEFLIRGGISIGNLTHDNDKFIGEALVNAVEIEKSTSFPRVEIDYKLYEKIKDTNILNYLKEDIDGKIFLNWIRFSKRTTEDHFINDFVKPIGIIKSKIDDFEKLPKIQEKWRYISKYFRDEEEIAQKERALEEKEIANKQILSTIAQNRLLETQKTLEN